MTKTFWFKPENPAPIQRDKERAEIPAGERINGDLKDHALALSDWPYRSVAATLHEWAVRFNDEFRLGLETPAIAIERMEVRTLGTYRPRRNGLGVRHEIALNALHLERPMADQLATLLHELLHQWQELYGKGGKGGYHNQQFRVLAKKFGLIVDDRGHRIRIEPGPLTNLLAKQDVDTSALRTTDSDAAPIRRPRGKSKLKRWTCSPGCTNVRCAVLLSAKCLKCGVEFVREED